MYKVAVDIKQAGAVLCFMREMRIPDFVIECLGGHVSSPIADWNKVETRNAAL
jgi:hypothetical protein